MTKFWSKWFRKFHRWIAVPTALAIPVAVIIKLIGSPPNRGSLGKTGHDTIFINADHGDQWGIFIPAALHR
jgi:hypothetical protein